MLKPDKHSINNLSIGIFSPFQRGGDSCSIKRLVLLKNIMGI